MSGQVDLARGLVEVTRFDPVEHSHIGIGEPDMCSSGCADRPCVTICPSGVYSCSDNGLEVRYELCLECGACIWACPDGNIDWHYPSGGKGVTYRY